MRSPEKRRIWLADRRERDRAKRAELKAAGLTERAYRSMTQADKDKVNARDPEAKKRSPSRYGPGRNFKKDREMVRALVDAQPFIQQLRSLSDDGSTTIACPACGREDANWEEYFCRYCGEHHDDLYLKDHLLAPIDLTREEIVEEYASVGLAFADRTNPIDSGLRFMTYADMTGIDHWAEMPRDYVKEGGGHQWDKLKGYQPDRESSLSIS